VEEFLAARSLAKAAGQSEGAGGASQVNTLNVSCRLEEEITMLAEDEESRKDIFREYGLEETGLWGKGV
jgi:hypothetical protein